MVCGVIDLLLRNYIDGVYIPQLLWGCLVCDFKQSFSVFKQHFTHFNVLFHPHVFSQMFSNNNFQFLNTYTKRPLCFCVIIKHFFFFFLRELFKHFTLQWISTVYEKGKKKKFGSPKLTTSHSKLRVDPNNPKIKIVTWPICVLY